MINIRPVSDLRNKYPEIEDLVLKEDEAVYLTKNGYGSMVVMSLEKYSKLMSDAEYNEYIENALDEADIEAENPNTKYYTHEEVFGKIRRKGNFVQSLWNLVFSAGPPPAEAALLRQQPETHRLSHCRKSCTRSVLTSTSSPSGVGGLRSTLMRLPE